MNPLVRSQLEQLETTLQALAEVLAETHSRLAKEQEDKERALQEYWSSGRKATILQETMDKLNGVIKENERLKARQEEVRQHTLLLLEYAHSLAGEYEK